MKVILTGCHFLIDPMTNMIVIVSGLPRSGTSLMMRMLDVGGMPVLTDHIRQANIDNPDGYYEFERVKALTKGDIDWLDNANGHAVKVISALLRHLPSKFLYKVIFMNRDLREVLASQHQMLLRRGVTSDELSDQDMLRISENHLRDVKTWLNNRSNFEILDVNYKQLVVGGEDTLDIINRIVAFLEYPLNAVAMQQTIKPDLYRNRA